MYYHICHVLIVVFFFFNDTATTEIYTLSLHDALPIWGANLPLVREQPGCPPSVRAGRRPGIVPRRGGHPGDRKSTRLNSSHLVISYAVFCLKKKIINKYIEYREQSVLELTRMLNYNCC